MNLRTFGSLKSANHKKDWVRNRNNPRGVIFVSTYVTNYLSKQIRGFAIRGTYFRILQLCKKFTKK
jgi:hypothetical protein